MNKEKEYFEEHIPHRVNLLITFRERFKGLKNEKGYYVRDFYRCSKDMAFIMVRFFMSEFGIKLDRYEDILVDENEKEIVFRRNEFKIDCIDINEVVKNETLNKELIDVLVAANKAVVHINNEKVYHYFDDEEKDDIIFSVIDFIENKIIDNIYHGKDEYLRVMNLEKNNMYRDRLKIQ